MDIIYNDDGTETLRYSDGTTITFKPSRFWTTLIPVQKGLTSYSWGVMDMGKFKPLKNKVIWI